MGNLLLLLLLLLPPLPPSSSLCLPVSSLAPSIHHFTHTSYGLRHCQSSPRRLPPAPCLPTTTTIAARLGSGVDKSRAAAATAGRARRSHHLDQTVNKCYVRRHSCSECGHRRRLRVVVARAAVVSLRDAAGSSSYVQLWLPTACGTATLPSGSGGSPSRETPPDWHLKNTTIKIKSFTMNVVSLRPRTPPSRPAPRCALIHAPGPTLDMC